MPGMEFFGEEERKEVMDVLETGALFRYNHEHLRKGHWKAKGFEEEVKNFTGAQYAHAVSSGSTAVAAILAAGGIGLGDEVIVPPFTYVAPIEGVMLAGALPVFAEIDESLCLSAEGIEKAISKNTKAVLLVHMCGSAADMDAILKVCQKHNLILLEDAGQAMGAFYKGRSVGLFGVAGAFSFDFFKITTCGEGGVVITNSKEAYEIMEQMSDHGHDHIGNNRGMEQHPIIGFNYRISELHAAIGLAQMRKINYIREAKKNNKEFLKKALASLQGITFRKNADEAGDSGTFLNFFMPTQELAQKTAKRLNEKGIAGINYWYTNRYHFINQWDHIKNLKFPSRLGVHHFEAPQDYNNLKLPQSQEVIGRLISIGISGKWNTTERSLYAQQLIEVIQEVLSGTYA